MRTFGVWWDDPLFLLLLLVVPFLVWRLVTHTGRGRVPIPRRDAITAIPSLRATLWWLPDGVRILAVIALALALARPQVEGPETIVGEGVDIMVALDMSGSMNAIDISERDLEAAVAEGRPPLNRFEVARDTLKQFIVNRHRAGHDRIGLVIFGPEAWLRYPLTHDHARLIRTINELVLDNGMRLRRGAGCPNQCTIDGGGTAIGDALGRAFNQIRRTGGQSRVVILITDGKQEGGTLDGRAIARHIRDLNEEEGEVPVRVYTFLIGGTGQVWVPEMDRFGRAVVDARGRQRYGRPMHPFATDPELLQEIAALTGGAYYDTYNEEEFREAVADLERTVFETEVHRPRHDRFPILLITGVLLVALEQTLRFTAFRSLV